MILCLLAVVILGILYLYWGNTSIKTTRINIVDSNIPDGFRGYTVAQVSDLQNASFGKNQDRLIKLLQEESPDIIAVTGDLIDSYHTDIDTAMAFVTRAVKVAPVYYINGNHEARVPQAYEELKRQMQQLGVKVLEHEAVSLEQDGSTLQLLGVSDPRFFVEDQRDSSFDRPIMTAALQNLMKNRDGYTILLSHRPELFDIYCSFDIDLVLCGHAHGGQVRLPLIGGLFAPDQGIFPKYTAGLYEDGKTKMVVSRGLGNSNFRLRVNNRPEVIFLTLTKGS